MSGFAQTLQPCSAVYTGEHVASDHAVTRGYGRAAVVLVACAAGACATLGVRANDAPPTDDPRVSVMARSRVWTPTDIRARISKPGRQVRARSPFRATVVCDYNDKKLGGMSPKFACVIGRDDEVKVKFGGNNGEVYGEVLATRLLWALGFGADRMYPVNVICRGCPAEFNGIERPSGESRFDPAVIERKMDGTDWGDKGWSWTELDRVDDERGGAAASASRRAQAAGGLSSARRQQAPTAAHRLRLEGEVARRPQLRRSPVDDQRRGFDVRTGDPHQRQRCIRREPRCVEGHAGMEDRARVCREPSTILHRHARASSHQRSRPRVSRRAFSFNCPIASFRISSRLHASISGSGRRAAWTRDSRPRPSGWTPSRPSDSRSPSAAAPQPASPPLVTPKPLAQVVCTYRTKTVALLAAGLRPRRSRSALTKKLPSVTTTSPG